MNDENSTHLIWVSWTEFSQCISLLSHQYKLYNSSNQKMKQLQSVNMKFCNYNLCLNKSTLLNFSSFYHCMSLHSKIQIISVQRRNCELSPTAHQFRESGISPPTCHCCHYSWKVHTEHQLATFFFLTSKKVRAPCRIF